MSDRVLNGRYSLVSLLGEGGMAAVYEAEDLLLGRRVAVKLLRDQFASDPGFLARFQREARAAAGLSHPNIISIFDVGTDNGLQYIVMELVEGRTLKEMILEEAPLPTSRIIDLGRHICEGLHYAHEHGVVHRDVKPHNILVTRDGRAKIADFGIAVALGASSLTQSGFIVGSAHYISPEQARGEQTTAASDLYSTGVVLYEMATGRLPFEGESSVAVALKQIQEDPVPPREINPRVPESLQAVILKSMAKLPEDRFVSGSEMAKALVAPARAGMEHTQLQPAVVGRPRQRSAAPDSAPASPERGRREKKGRGSTGWAVMVVVLAAFLCTLGSIPLGLMAYANGWLGNLSPALAGGSRATPAPPAPSPTVPAAGAKASPVASPTAAATATPTPAAAPSLVGVPFTQAYQSVQSQGMELAIAGKAFSAEYPIDYVVSQKPLAGSPVDRGGRIEVVVSQGKEPTTVPGVAGDTLSAARAKLQEAGLEARVTEEWGDQTPAGVVMAQNPSPNTKTEKGEAVYLTVSKGREKVPVPSLVGRPEAEAQDAIVRAGLTKAWVNYQDHTTVPPGRVISQEPKPDTMVEKGTTVYIAVRKPQPTPQPTPTAPTKNRRD